MDILIEFQMEEIPARMQGMAEETLKLRFESFCKENSLNIDQLRILSTPRRLALIANDLPEHQADQVIERKGPRIDAPQTAIDGFFKSVGLSTETCQKIETPKGTFWIANVVIPGQSLRELIVSFIEQILTQFPWPKTMRWGTVPFRWVRPLHHILVLLQDTPLDGEILGIPLTSTTLGHRFLGRSVSAPLSSIEAYESFLNMNYVIADRHKRKHTIEDQLRHISHTLGLNWNDDPTLLDEVTGLVEYPVVIYGQINQEFMDLPVELMVSVMRTHQRYFSFFTSDGNLAPYFAFAANNLVSASNGNTVRHGNEKVLKARLSDGKFYWETDKKTSLKTFASHLETIVFHQRLGTLKQKQERVANLALYLNQWIKLPNVPLEEAALLCKADLVSGVVGEFPELQGIMGGYYAIHEGRLDIAKAIRDVYKPLGPKDSLPEDLMGTVIALCDKLDTLVGFFAIGEKPTGSKDPFALRRSALGILRLLFALHEVHKTSLRISLPLLIEESLKQYQNKNQLSFDTQAVVKDTVHFVMDRLKVSFKDAGYPYDRIEAVFKSFSDDPIFQIKERLLAVTEYLTTPDAPDLLDTYQRLWNILKHHQHPHSVSIHTQDFTSQAEHRLYEEFQRRNFQNVMLHENYKDALHEFTKMKPFIDTFFDTVMVNVDDQRLRDNRLSLLRLILTPIKSFASFEEIVNEIKN